VTGGDVQCLSLLLPTIGQRSKGYASDLSHAQDPYARAPRTADRLTVAGGSGGGTGAQAERGR
jgi:hypothetical protein